VKEKTAMKKPSLPGKFHLLIGGKKCNQLSLSYEKETLLPPTNDSRFKGTTYTFQKTREKNLR